MIYVFNAIVFASLEQLIGVCMFDPITCHGQSWGNYCMVCEQEEAEKHAKENELPIEDRYYEYEETNG